jgi:hypothetical protein
MNYENQPVSDFEKAKAEILQVMDRYGLSALFVAFTSAPNRFYGFSEIKSGEASGMNEVGRECIREMNKDFYKFLSDHGDGEIKPRGRAQF